MKYLVLAFMLLCATPSFAQSQMEMVKAAQADYFKVDKKLNQVYNRIQLAYKSDKVFLKDLKQAQLAWIAFRDKQVALRYPNRPDMGSATPMCRFAYIQQLTEQRIAELQQWLDGIPEGDICTGTIHNLK